MRPEPWSRLAWVVAAGMTALAWLGYRQPDLGFAWFGWAGLCA